MFLGYPTMSGKIREVGFVETGQEPDSFFSNELWDSL